MRISSEKITLAALIIGTFAAATAQAQSNVTVYGLVDLGIAKTTGQPTVQRENNASRLGSKGTEDLGGGLSAIFNLESEFWPIPARKKACCSTVKPMWA